MPNKKRSQKLGVNFSKLWTSSAISSVGDGALESAGPLLVASHTHDPALVAGAVFAQQLPWLLFSLLAGVYVDRLNRRQLLISANLLRAAAIGGLALAIAGGAASLPLIYLGLFVLGTGDTLADNTAVALLPGIVTADGLSVANARLQGANLIGRQLAGPPLGAWLFVVAAALPFGLDAATFVIAALLINWLRKSHIQAEKPHVKPSKKSVRSEMKEGFRWLWGTPLLKTLALSIAVLNVTFMAEFASFVLFVQQRLGLGPVGFGTLLAAEAIGGVLGTLIVHPLESTFKTATLLRAALVIEAGIDLCFVFVRSPWLAGVLFTVFGAHAVVWGVVTVSLRQRTVPGELIGRVNSVYNLFRMGGVAIGALIGGLVAQAYGITAPFWFAGITVSLLAVFAWRYFDYQTENLLH